MMPDRSKHPVSLEDLLRVKRAERPAGDFWAQFDQQMRAKQLAAIVNKRPWWHFTLSGLWRGLGRLQLPVGATAVLALTFWSVREYRFDGPSGAEFAPTDVAAVPAEEVVAAEPVSGGVHEAATGPAVVNQQGGSVTEVATVDTPPAVTASNQAAAVWPSSLLFGTAETAEMSPSARSIAANLAAAEENGLEVGRLVEVRSTSFSGASSPSAGRTARVEPLAQLTAPGESRRARLAAYVAAADEQPVITRASSRGVRDRAASRINEQELYDSVSRLGVGGDRLVLKF